VLSHLAFIALLQGNIERATVLQTESLRDARTAGNKSRTAWALQDLARYAFLNGDDVRGHALLDESQSLFEELQDQGGYSVGRLTLALALQGQGDGTQALALLRESTPRYFGWALVREGDYRQATDVLQESLAEYRKAREFERIPQILNMLGEAALALGNFLEARGRFRESQALCRELGNTWDSAGALLGEGHVALAEGDIGAASASYTEALKLFANLPDWDHRRRRTGVAACLEGLAGTVAPERATRLYGAAARLRAAVGRAVLSEFDVAYPLPGNRAVNDVAQSTVWAALGEEAFDAAWTAGQALTLEQAVAEALGDHE
jgi:tetratricopeptide (TPR) repeat protein